MEGSIGGGLGLGWLQILCLQFDVAGVADMSEILCVCSQAVVDLVELYLNKLSSQAIRWVPVLNENHRTLQGSMP